jgi:hypothetical protein
MNRDEAADLLDSLGNKLLAELHRRLPSDREGRFALFLEITRITDYWLVSQQLAPPEKQLSPHDLSLTRWGWSLAARHLLRPLGTGGIPVTRSDHGTLRAAGAVVREFGRVFLLHRCAAMVRAGFMTARRENGVLVAEQAEFSVAHLLDDYELNRWLDLEEKLKSGDHPLAESWQSLDASRWPDAHMKPGNWIASRGETSDEWLLPDPLALMSPLIHPWSPGHGPVMMGYGSTEEIDLHFIAEATRLIRGWSAELGIGGSVAFGPVDGAVVAALAHLVASFCLKHVAFSQAAARAHKTISIPHSLTIWTPVRQFQEDIAAFTGLGSEAVGAGLGVLSLHASEAESLPETATFSPPLLIDLGNGYYLRPVSAVTRNPLAGAATMLAWRDRPAWDRVLATREERMRAEFYSLFQGVRYARVEGSVKIRDGDRTVTDIDAAILDRTSGDLLLVQLKWQDRRTNDFRSFRSRARNLSDEMNRWATDVLSWLDRNSLQEVSRALRFRSWDGGVRRTYLLGLSRDMARPDGFGYRGFPEQLAVANWYHFLRTRFEIGPAEEVFGAIRARLRNDHASPPDLKSLPFEFTAAGERIRIERLWSAYPSA